MCKAIQLGICPFVLNDQRLKPSHDINLLSKLIVYLRKYYNFLISGVYSSGLHLISCAPFLMFKHFLSLMNKKMLKRKANWRIK